MTRRMRRQIPRAGRHVLQNVLSRPVEHRTAHRSAFRYPTREQTDQHRFTAVEWPCVHGPAHRCRAGAGNRTLVDRDPRHDTAEAAVRDRRNADAAAETRTEGTDAVVAHLMS